MIGFEAKIPRYNVYGVKDAVYKCKEQYKEAVAMRFKDILYDEFYWQSTEYYADIEGSGDWAELSEFTIKKKGHDVILFETGEYNLSIFAEKDANGEWTAGVRSTKFDPIWHEYGFVNARTGKWVPARPVIGPAVREVNREIKYEGIPDAVKAVKYLTRNINKVIRYDTISTG